MNVQTAAFTCRRCGRPLRDPESIQRGIGPVCAGYEAAWQLTQADGGESTIAVTVNDAQAHPTALKHIVCHSPTGMEWGYAGSGPADLALSILAHYLGEEDAVERYLHSSNWVHMEQPVAIRLHHEFKDQFISHWGNSWRITGEQIASWLAYHGIEAPVRDVVYEGRRAL
ncbi:MAG: hypothetical protein BAA04_07000 [Firmicutes bacterium ZCTH02-B6]|nr:MAG: hypothetical protein BAA04_07000 [Firmicutes bacterium ZCTH02-B6]